MLQLLLLLQLQARHSVNTTRKKETLNKYFLKEKKQLVNAAFLSSLSLSLSQLVYLSLLVQYNPSRPVAMGRT
jgi:hypothetical protein